MRNWTMGKKLFTCVGALIGVVALLGGLALQTAADIKSQLDVASSQTALKIELAHEIQETVVRLRSEQRRALIAAFAKDPETVAAAATRIEVLERIATEHLDSIAPLLVSDAGRQSVSEMRRLSKEWHVANGDTLVLVRSGLDRQAWAMAREKSNPLIDQIDARGEELLKQQQAFLAASRASGDSSYWRAHWLLLAAIAAALVVGVAAIVAVRGVSGSLRETARALREGAEEVASASTQVAIAAQSLSQGATEQAASLEETSASMEEVSSMTRANADGARRAATLITGVEQELTEANSKLGCLVQTMTDISESSGRVAKIIKAIDEIAFQTNILALNAAVEAARAGESGMGFAVVADEVRSLAQRSAEAARSTAEMIEASSRNADLGVKRVEDVAAAIRLLTTNVATVRNLSEEVSAASDQQSQGIGQMTTAVGEMEKVTQSTAATAEESAAASEELSAQAETTMDIVKRLDTMVGGDRSGMKPGHRTNGVGAKAGATVVRMRTRREIPSGSVSSENTGTFGKW